MLHFPLFVSIGRMHKSILQFSGIAEMIPKTILEFFQFSGKPGSIVHGERMRLLLKFLEGSHAVVSAESETVDKES